jgi:RNA-binding protein
MHRLGIIINFSIFSQQNVQQFTIFNPEIPMLKPSFKRELKAKAHHLKPVILLGSKGLTSAVMNETDIALKAHELIKVKIHGAERAERQGIVDELCQTVQADCVQLIGCTAIIYRKNEELL